MKKGNNIQVFEHGRLYLNDRGFTRKHLNALLKLNEYHGGNYFEAIADGLKFKQYVGIIQVDGLSIEILPKADKLESDEKWQNVLIPMLKACGKLKAQTAGAANVKRQNLNLLEVYFELYLKEVEVLLHKGLVKKYRQNRGNVTALKGKLLFAQNIKHNLIHKERFYTQHQVYDKDHFLHQVLSKALHIVESFSKGSSIYNRCKKVLLDFPEVKDLKITESALTNLKLNRKTASYKDAVELARLIILNYSPDISSGREKMLSILFNMNQLWEEYVLVSLRKALDPSKYEITGQDNKSFIHSNSLKPDIVIHNKVTSECMVVDTKWKLPKNLANVSDLRQMYTYARFWNAEKTVLLYPGNERNTDFGNYLTEDFFMVEEAYTSVTHQCKLAFVHVLNEDGELDETIGWNIKRQLNLE